MTNCCNNEAELVALRRSQGGTLKLVLGINVVMFAVVLGGGLLASSAALVSDSLDNLGDALTYGLSLYAVHQGSRTKARVALFKAAMILFAAMLVLGQVFYRLAVPTLPSYELMGALSLLALLANTVCLIALTRHRSDDVNMSSVWECSRNDIFANLSVFVAAGAVWLTQSPWPDLLVAMALICLFLCSAFRVFRDARKQLQPAA